MTIGNPAAALMARLSADQRTILIALACLILLLVAGSLVAPQILSAEFLMQQLQRAAYLGIIALGQSCVILLGRIDLSMPWTMATAAILGTAVAASTGIDGIAVPVGILVGMAVGLVNGLGVALLRVPAMIFTLGINSVLLGLMTLFTGGGFAPGDNATSFMSALGVGTTAGIPNPVWIWAVLALVLGVLHRRTVHGRVAYAMGRSEVAAYLSGNRTRLTLITAFVICGFCAGLAGMLVAGYAGKAAQSMGDPFLLPSIAAVVLGGTSVLGGRGTVAGTVIGVLLITLLGSILTVAQIFEGGRLIIYSLAILAMLLVYGREQRTSG